MKHESRPEAAPADPTPIKSVHDSTADVEEVEPFDAQLELALSVGTLCEILEAGVVTLDLTLQEIRDALRDLSGGDTDVY